MPPKAELGLTLVILQCLLFTVASLLFPEDGYGVLLAIGTAHLVWAVSAYLLYIVDRYGRGPLARLACIILQVILSPVVISWMIHKLALSMIWILSFSWRCRDSC